MIIDSICSFKKIIITKKQSFVLFFLTNTHCFVFKLRKLGPTKYLIPLHSDHVSRVGKKKTSKAKEL